jgi:hypothetical protein
MDLLAFEKGTTMIDVLQNFWFLCFGMVTITSVVGALAHAWQKVTRGAQQAALKHEMLQRGMSAEDIERVMRAGSSSEENAASRTRSDAALIEELLESLGECQASAAVIEQVLARIQAADPVTRQSACRAVQALIRGSGCEGDDERIIAVVRGICQPVNSPGAERPSALGDPGMHPGAFSKVRTGSDGSYTS